MAIWILVCYLQKLSLIIHYRLSNDGHSVAQLWSLSATMIDIFIVTHCIEVKTKFGICLL